MKKGNNVFKGIIIGVLAFVVVLSVIVIGLKSVKNSNSNIKEENVAQHSDSNDRKNDDKNKVDEKSNKVEIQKPLLADFSRKIMSVNFDESQLAYTPQVPAYQTEPGCSNVINIGRFYLQDDMLDKIAENNFVVVNSNYSEFFDLYEMNRYLEIPSFITTDSMMHTYHLYFAMLQKNTEKNYLSNELNSLSVKMFENSVDLYNKYIGTEWEDAASRNVAYFAIGAIVSGNNIDIPDYVADVVAQEISFIESADGIHTSLLINENEDYSQYKPRGYYEGDEQLENYFKAMMWYGRRNMKQSEEVENRMAFLMNLAMDEEALAAWEKIYSITAFFAGASDDCGYYEYMQVMSEAYKNDFSDIVGNSAAFDAYTDGIKELEAPKINSIVFDTEVNDDTDRLKEGKGYRFMGQRFTLDASIFTQLCYSKVRENSNGEYRMLPTGLDVPAAMGSDAALSILKAKGNMNFKNYEGNMNKLREDISNAPDLTWEASLYGGWLDTLRPLLTKKSEGYPSFMTNEAWERKSVESFLGSWTELKHDTVLYSKQFLAEMGGGDIEEDSRGYVEPEPELFDHLYVLTNDTINGLDEFGVIGAEDKENLQILANLSLQLRDISIKELNNEDLSDAEYEFIKEYGGNIEHLWRKTITDVPEGDYVDCAEYPCALVTDVATDPNGSVLEEAIGGASVIYVVVPIDGELHLTTGAVFSYYEFDVPISERMTDSSWRRMIGMELTDDMEYQSSSDVAHPDWTDMYRCGFNYAY